MNNEGTQQQLVNVKDEPIKRTCLYIMRFLRFFLCSVDA